MWPEFFGPLLNIGGRICYLLLLISFQAGFPCQPFIYIGPGGGLEDPQALVINAVFEAQHIPEKIIEILGFSEEE